MEIRVHGIRNTPPHDMLETSIENVTVECGDALAGFSTSKNPTATHRIEAYSWGRLARYTGIRGAGRATDTVVKILWLFLAPFGMTNAAYWARHDLASPGTSQAAAPEDTSRIEDAVGKGIGAGLIRLLGFLLTLLFVSVACVIAFEILPLAQRRPLDLNLSRIPLAVLTLIPVVSVGIVALLPTMGRTRYIPGLHTGPAVEPPTGQDDDGAPVATTVPLLAHPKFWRVGAGIGHLSIIHLAGALALIGLVLWGERTAGLLGVLGQTPPEAVAHLGWYVSLLIAGQVLCLVGALGQIVFSGSREAGAAVGIGRWAVLGVSVVLLILSSVHVGGSSSEHHGDASMAVTIVSACLAVILLLLAFRGLATGGTPKRALGWYGFGSLVFGLLAVGFSFMLSLAVLQSAVVVLKVSPDSLDLNRYGGGFLIIAVGLFGLLLLGWLQNVYFGPKYRSEIFAQLTKEAAHWGAPADRMAAARKIEKSRHWSAMWRRAEFFAGALAICIAAGLLWTVGSSIPWLADLTGISKLMQHDWAHLLTSSGLWLALAIVVALALLSSAQEPRPVALLWDLMCFLPTQAHPFGPPCYTERSAPELADRISRWLADTEEDPPSQGANSSTNMFPVPGAAGRRVILATHSMGLIVVLATIFHLKARGVPEAQLQRIGLVSYGVQVRRYFARFFPRVFGPQIMSLVPAGGPAILARNPWPLDVAGEIAAETTPERMKVPVTGELTLAQILGDRWINLYRPNDPLGFPIRYVMPEYPGSSAELEVDCMAEEYDPKAYLFTAAGHRLYLPTRAYSRAITRMMQRLEYPESSAAATRRSREESGAPEP